MPTSIAMTASSRPAAVCSGSGLRRPQVFARPALAASCTTRSRASQRPRAVARATQGSRGSCSSMSGSLDSEVEPDTEQAAAALERLYLAAATSQQVPPTAAAWINQQQAVALAPAAAVVSKPEHIGADGAAGSFFAKMLDMLPGSPRTRGIIMINLLVILVATNWVVVKDVGATFDPFGFAFLRFGVAAAAFSPFLKRASKHPQIMKAGVELGFWFAAGYLAQSAGLLTTDASRASFLSTFTVLVVPFLVGLSGRGVSPITWASCVAALVGVGLLEQSGAEPGIGDVWSMISAVAFGVQVFRTEHWARILGNNSNLSLMSVVLTTTMLFAALAAGATHTNMIMNIFHHPGMAGNMFSADIPWAQVLYCGLLTTDLTLLMEVYALQDVSSVECAIIYTLEPVLGAGFAWAILGERVGAKGMVGAAIILASSLVTQLLGKPEEEGEKKLLSEKSE